MDKCVNAARRAIQDYLDQEAEGATVHAAKHVEQYSRVMRKIPVPVPLVLVIIPTKNQPEALQLCLKGIIRDTDYPNLEILVVDNNSDDQRALQIQRGAALDPRVRLLFRNEQFCSTTGQRFNICTP